MNFFVHHSDRDSRMLV